MKKLTRPVKKTFLLRPKRVLSLSTDASERGETDRKGRPVSHDDYVTTSVRFGNRIHAGPKRRSARRRSLPSKDNGGNFERR